MSITHINKEHITPTRSRTLPISTISEHKKYNLSLYQRNTFSYTNRRKQGQLHRRTVSFRFRSMEFSKKRALPFFLSLELLTNRKCMASLSGRNMQAWKIRKGRLVGCKVTLREKALDSFIDTLGLALPRREKYQPPRWTKKHFYGTQRNLPVISNRTAPSLALSVGELVLFHPIELGLGLHPDVQRVELNFLFNTFTIEERFFLLRASAIPILY